MRLLLLGASGLVGSAVARLASAAGHQVIGVVGRFAGDLPGVAEKLRCDLAAEAELSSLLRATRPDAVLNAAAISEPAACDRDPASSEAMNVQLPAKLAHACAEAGTRFVHISSEQVFDGRQRAPYRPTDPTSPINLYGEHKLAAEQLVLAAAPAVAAVVRAPLLMGNSANAKRGLHERLLLDWASGRPVTLFVDEYRQPCTGEGLSRALLELAERPELTGLFHWAGAELISRYELGLRVRARFGLDDINAPIRSITREDMPALAANRQPCLALDLAPLSTQLKTRPQTLEEQLADARVPPDCAGWFDAARGKKH